MRSAVLLVALAGLVGLLAVAALDEREVAYPTGLPAVREAAALAPGQETCWGPVAAPEPFAAVRLVTSGGGPLDVTVRAGGRERRGRAPAGAGNVTARVGAVDAERVELCARNAGDRRIVLFGAPPDARAPALADPGLRAVPAAVLVRAEPRSVLAELPQAAARAARFDGGWVGTWTVWAVLAGVALGVPALLARALYASERSSSATGTGSRSGERSS